MNGSSEMKLVTGAEVGINGDAQVRLALETIAGQGGIATTPQLYDALTARLPVGTALSEQGKSSLRFYVNKVAVEAGYVYPFDKASPGWRITPEGRDYLGVPQIVEIEHVINVDTQQVEAKPSNSAKGAAFEKYVLKLLKQMYPFYTWYHQGLHKQNERGLDFIGDRIGDRRGEQRIGVQVKFHAQNNALTQDEWLKFLAGCFTRRVSAALLITTGRLTGAQRREAGEADVTVIEGRDEVTRIAGLHSVEAFDLFDDGVDQLDSSPTF